jgi:hypothetical protein
MKQTTLIIVTLLIGSVFTVSAQKRLPYEVKKGIAGCDTIYTLPDEKASFPGGTSGMYEFFKDNLQNSGKLTNMINSNKRLMLELVVDDKGKIARSRVINTFSQDFSKDALAAIKKAPELNPARANGKNVCSYLIIPLLFE